MTTAKKERNRRRNKRQRERTVLSLGNTLSERIKTINQMDKPNFSQMFALRSGKDEFSIKKARELFSMFSPLEYEFIKSHFPDEPKPDVLIARVYRWILRGLDPMKAVHKVKVDLEVSKRGQGINENFISGTQPMGEGQGHVQKGDVSNGRIGVAIDKETLK